ncbi:glutamate-5-semialdehyde dehydrogenase [Fulvivirgaceae bacterium BMA12]|uniref:Gamma-glutamyl phosphate reductase n=1 Tax=Agaribacillus aureus TaxID=3051825 RepID=A0ABT8L116_9BACT|nr:glutamate-5-semialdehyde dehydrogenase [Fulvivirgaceae bacterium BMA12]
MTTEETIIPLLEKANATAPAIQKATDQVRKQILLTLARLIDEHRSLILEENAKDVIRMEDGNPKKDRLILNEQRIDDLIAGLEDVAALPDPTGKTLYESKTADDLEIKKITVPLGTVGVIYESRPNVTIDVAALCLRSGNCAILRGGSDAEYSNKALVTLIHRVLASHDLPESCIQLLPTDRQFVKELLEAKKFVDIIIPRGSQELIDFVRENSKVPTIETGAGVCHTFVSRSAQLDKASEIVVNAKVSRPSVCNALDTILVEEAVAASFLPLIVKGMKAHNVQMFADQKAFPILQQAGYELLEHASESDFGREFLDYKCSVKVVENFEEAVTHIRKYSSKHSEAIVAEDVTVLERFLNEVDAAAVYANASTRFTDGGVFGLGAEIGISTQKLHARGPFALEKLITEKWVVKGDGQIRE